MMQDAAESCWSCNPRYSTLFLYRPSSTWPRNQAHWEQRYLLSASCAHTKCPYLQACCKSDLWRGDSAHPSLDEEAQGASAAYISASFPVLFATSKGIPSKRYKLLLNIIAQILSIYKVLLSLFCDISVLSRIQIPSGAVLPTSLLRKETRKVTRQFHCLKAKNRGWRGLNDRSNPCFSSIFLYWGLFCPEKHEKNSLVLVDKRGFFRGARDGTWTRTS